jgi:hypothetical protein
MQWGNKALRPLLGLSWDAGGVTTGPVTGEQRLQNARSLLDFKFTYHLAPSLSCSRVNHRFEAIEFIASPTQSPFYWRWELE